MKLITTLLPIAALVVAACGGPGRAEQPAFLTIIGDTNVFLDNGATQKVRVRYHDGNGDPLAGEIEFALDGSTGGASISKRLTVTNRDGIAEISISGGANGVANFQLEAFAEAASPVRWTVQVGGLPDIDPTGLYQLESELDIVSGLESDIGNALNAFIDMTDGPNDPATWLIDQGVKEIDDDLINTIFDIGIVRAIVDPAVNDLILNEDVQKIKDVGSAIGDVTREFGMTSTLEIKATRVDIDGEEGYEATHTMTAVNFTVEGEKKSYSMDGLQLPEPEAREVVITTNAEGQLIISQHDLPFSYGAALKLVIDKAIVPLFDDEADNLGEFMINRIPCDSIGQSMYDNGGSNVPLTSPSTYEGLCEIGVLALAGIITEELLKIDDAGVLFQMIGAARPRDTNGDRKIDRLQAGRWSGTILYGGSPSDLDPEANTFSGERLTGDTQ